MHSNIFLYFFFSLKYIFIFLHTEILLNNFIDYLDNNGITKKDRDWIKRALMYFYPPYGSISSIDPTLFRIYFVYRSLYFLLFLLFLSIFWFCKVWWREEEYFALFSYFKEDVGNEAFNGSDLFFF